MDRESRRITNSTQASIREIDYYPSYSGVPEGELVISSPKNRPLRLYKKLNGILWRTDLTKDGDEIIDRDLKVNRNLTVNGDITVKGMPYYTNLPAFSAYQSSSSDDEAYVTGEFTKVTFDTEIYDIGGNFSSSKFTAPVNGIYTFSAKVLFDSGHGGGDDHGDWATEDRHDIYLYKNESSSTPSDATANRVAGELGIISGTLTDQFLMNSVTVDLKLDKNDYIAVHVYHDSGHNQRSYSVGIDDFTQFSGRLVTAL